MRWLLIAILLTGTCPNLATAKCEPELRNIPEPDMQFILERLPRLASANRVKGQADELIPLMEWFAKYEFYKHQQWTQDERETGDIRGSHYAYFEKLKDRKDGREYADGIIHRGHLLAFRQKKKPVPLNVQEHAFVKDIEMLIQRDMDAAVKGLTLSEKREFIRRLLVLAQNIPVWHKEMFGLTGWVNPVAYDINELIDRVAGLNVEPRYRRLPPPSHLESDDEYDHPDPYSYDMETTNYLTTYTDYSRLFAHLDFKPGQTFVEIGAGFARASLVLDLLYPGVKYIGYEIVPERVRNASGMIERLKLENAEVLEADVLASNFKLESADFYYTYNPLDFNPLAKLKSQLQQIAKRRDPLLIVIPERGQYRAEQRWLTRLRLPRTLRLRSPAQFYRIKSP